MRYFLCGGRDGGSDSDGEMHPHVGGKDASCVAAGMEEVIVVLRCIHMSFSEGSEGVHCECSQQTGRQKPPTAWTLVQNGAHGNHVGMPRDRTKDLTLREIQCDRILGIRSLFSGMIMLIW